MVRGEEVVLGEVSATGCENGIASETDQDCPGERLSGGPRPDRLSRRSPSAAQFTCPIDVLIRPRCSW